MSVWYRKLYGALIALALAACGTSVTVDGGLAILDTSPSGGAVNIDRSAEIFVVLNAEVDAATLGAISLHVAGESNEVSVNRAVEIADARIISITPLDSLSGETGYELRIGAGLKSGGVGGQALGVGVIKRFTTGR
jgi:hypothetical protein